MASAREATFDLLRARECTGRDAMIEALREAIAVSDGPSLGQVPVAYRMWPE